MSAAAHRAAIFFEGVLESGYGVAGFNFDSDVGALEDSEAARLGNATEANLQGFKDRGES
jgi:hypothetical protein